MLRVLPWITDGATDFLDGFLFNRLKNGAVSIFEFGIGNSTLYFLSKGCSVTAIEHDQEWFTSVQRTAEQFKYGERLKAACLPRPYNAAYQASDYDIVSIDGRDRVSCLKTVLEAGLSDKTILLLDNTERVRTERYGEYTELLQDLNQIHFEHPCVPGAAPQVGNYNDRSGGRVRHRWVTTVAYKRGGEMLTTRGNVF